MDASDARAAHTCRHNSIYTACFAWRLWTASTLVWPTDNTYVNVPDNDWALRDENGHKLEFWTFSSQRASAPKLTYKSFIFHPQDEREKMEKIINDQNFGDTLKQVKDSHSSLTLLHDGRILGSEGKLYEPTSDLALADPKKQDVVKLPGLKVPRMDSTVVQLKDGRVLWIGGETTKQFADDGTDNLTNTVEALDLDSGKTEVIGRILVPRHAVIAEVIGDLEVLIVGGWNQRSIARDERWWPGAEIFRVPPRRKDH